MTDLKTFMDTVTEEVYLLCVSTGYQTYEVESVHASPTEAAYAELEQMRATDPTALTEAEIEEYKEEIEGDWRSFMLDSDSIIVTVKPAG